MPLIPPTLPTAVDVVIIGAGSAGSVIARRLLDAGLRIAVLEAGPVDDSEAIHDPLGSIGLWDSPYNWGFETVPQAHAMGKTYLQPRGKTLGGSSAFNGMVYVRGVRQDYDRWSQEGAPGWDWDSVEPYFRKLENYEGGAAGGRGVGGLMNVQRNKTPNALIRDWVEAAQAAGHPYNDDYNSGEIVGVSYTQHTIRDHRRATTWVQYMRPIENHPNLLTLTEATVSQLLIESGRVVGVKFRYAGAERILYADQEVVLSAGVFGTPQILMLSGIGSGDVLRSYGITVQAHLPGVGQNLQDHFSSPIIYETPEAPPAPTEQGLEAQFFAKTRPGLAVPDVQPILMSFVYAFIDGKVPGQGFSVVSQILHPLGRGEVRLRSTNPSDAPLIDPRVLFEPDDLEVLVDNMDQLRAVAAQPQMRKWIKAEARPGDEIRTRQDMRDYVRATVVPGHHQVGTAKMGLDAMAVVDPELRLHGLEGLRIADASIMPSITTGNTNGPSIMIGERAADFILGT